MNQIAAFVNNDKPSYTVVIFDLLGAYSVRVCDKSHVISEKLFCHSNAITREVAKQEAMTYARSIIPLPHHVLLFGGEG